MQLNPNDKQSRKGGNDDLRFFNVKDEKEEEYLQ